MITQVNSWGFLRDYKGIPEGKAKEYKSKLLNAKEFRDSEHILFKAAKLHINDFIKAGKLLTLQPYVKEIIKKIFENGKKIIINSAAPHIMINEKVKEIGTKYFLGIFSMEPQFDQNGYFYDTILPFETKDFEVDKIGVIEFVRKREKIQINEVVHIGDGVTDISSFRKYYGISFNEHNKKVKMAANLSINTLEELLLI